MQEFVFTNPTKLIFGRGVANQVGRETARYGKRVLLVSGKSSAKKSGLYNDVMRSLRAADVSVTEQPGVLPNPRLATCLEGIELCRENGIEVVLGIGGGSVLDSAKAIAAGACYNGSLWDFFEKKAVIKRALPVVTIVTMAATGSEYNRITVIKNEERHAKAGLWNENLFPKVSLVDPELTFSVSPLYTAYGGVDIISHVLERYINGQPTSIVQLRFKEALMRSVMEAVEQAQATPMNYDARSTLLWAGSLACSSIFDTGLSSSDIPAHIIDTEAAGFSDHAHGAGLAVILPAVMRYYVDRFPYTTARFATEVLGLVREEPEVDMALKGIDAFRKWLRRIGCPVTMQALGIGANLFAEIASRVDRNEEGPDREDTLAILNLYRE
ncbi:MAG: iron-containing alcohol dehydrogenase [Spirochaetaceae bacterium]|nr:MAG: iron-containing alcohol dehydrogenase [Spirochaetaceae bacterium]